MNKAKLEVFAKDIAKGIKTDKTSMISGRF